MRNYLLALLLLGLLGCVFVLALDLPERKLVKADVETKKKAEAVAGALNECGPTCDLPVLSERKLLPVGFVFPENLSFYFTGGKVYVCFPPLSRAHRLTLETIPALGDKASGVECVER